MTSQAVSDFQPTVKLAESGSLAEVSFYDMTYTDQEVKYKKSNDDEDFVMLPVRFHSFTIAGLEPDTEYEFYIDGIQQGTFKTAPQNTSAAVSFAILSDTQQSNYQLFKNHFGLVAQEIQEYSYDFLINTGDLVNAGWSGREWDWLFANSQELFSHSLFAPTMGNHEALDVDDIPGDIYYRLRFKTTGDASSSLGSGTYSFDYGCVHVAVLDTQGTDTNILAEWLKNDMEQAENQWRVVVLHDSLFSIIRDQSSLREALSPVFEELGVRIVFSGHDHVYSRSVPIAYDESLYDADNESQGAVEKEGAPVYVTTGRACDKTYSLVRSLSIFEVVKQGSDPNLDSYYDKENYLMVQADDTSMNITVYGIDGTILDQFSLSKTPSPTKSPSLEISVSLSPKTTESNQTVLTPTPTVSEVKSGNSADILLILAAAAAGTVIIAICVNHRKTKNRRSKRRR